MADQDLVEQLSSAGRYSMYSYAVEIMLDVMKARRQQYIESGAGPEQVARVDQIIQMFRERFIMTLENETDEQVKRWVYGINDGNAGGFLNSIRDAAQRADWENYPLLRPVIVELMKKYPQYRFEGQL